MRETWADEEYYDQEYYDEEYYDTGRTNRPILLIMISGCIGALLGFACAACLSLVAVEILLSEGESSPVLEATATPVSTAPDAQESAPPPAPASEAPAPVDTPSPQPVDTSTLASEPQHFSGRGQQASPKFMLNPGTATFRITHDGNGLFYVCLLDSNGYAVGPLAGELAGLCPWNVDGGGPQVGPIVYNPEGAFFDGSVAIGIPQQGEYVLNVVADGNWTVSVEQ